VKISILVHPTFDSIGEVERAISITNRVQRYFELELITASWVEKKVLGKNMLDFNNLYQQKKKRLGESPAVIVTKLPQKDNFVTWYEPGFYTVSLGDWETRYQIPPIRTLVMYYIAGILPSFCSVFPEGSDEGMYHEERPIGCISDTCPRGNDDVLISMKGARVCTKCARIYRQYGCSEEALAALRKILNYVREETARYDKGIPYDVFISYSHDDQLFVDRLVRDLEDRRLKVWRDGFMLLPGQGIIEKVINGIATSRFLLCVLSRKSVRSKWVKKELEVAVTRSLERGTEKIAVLPTLIEECKIPQVLYGLYYVSFRDDYDLALNKVVAAVQVRRRQTYHRTKSAKESRS
jgi:hypothetical protein